MSASNGHSVPRCPEPNPTTSRTIEVELPALLRRAKRRRVKPHVWLTIEQFAVLDYLRCKNGVVQAGIVAEFDDSPAVIVRQVEALERRGLLRRRLLAHRDEVLELTNTGRQVLAAASESRD